MIVRARSGGQEGIPGAELEDTAIFLKSCLADPGRHAEPVLGTGRDAGPSAWDETGAVQPGKGRPVSGRPLPLPQTPPFVPSFHFRTEGGAAKGNAEASFPASAAETKPPLAPASPPAPTGTTVPGSSLEGPTPNSASVPSTPTLLAWKQLASAIPQMPQMPASVPHLPASPLATTSLENAKPQVKPGFLQFQEK